MLLNDVLVILVLLQGQSLRLPVNPFALLVLLSKSVDVPRALPQFLRGVVQPGLLVLFFLRVLVAFELAGDDVLDGVVGFRHAFALGRLVLLVVLRVDLHGDALVGVVVLGLVALLLLVWVP